MTGDSPASVLIVGGGLAGLCCARTLHAAGVPFRLFEASDRVGGRVRSDLVDGFRLDRGFQVLQTAYPEAKAVLDYDRLDLHAFEPGALIRVDDQFRRMTDPWRRPLRAASSVVAGVGSLGDLWRMAKLRSHIKSADSDELLDEDPTSTERYLRERGFSDTVINQFFRPWFAGVFLERDLVTASSFFEFVFKMLAIGDASLPREGMAAIPAQLAEPLPDESIHLNTPVAEVKPSQITLHDGTVHTGDAVVIATEGPAVAELLGEAVRDPGSCGTVCFYYAAGRSPVGEPILVLNGNGTGDSEPSNGAGPINNLCVPSDVCRDYAPEGQALISISVVGEIDRAEDELENSVRDQLRDWYGDAVNQWSHLRTDRIPHAVPGQPPGEVSSSGRNLQLSDGLYRCGDATASASIQGAMRTGREVAELILKVH